MERSMAGWALLIAGILLSSAIGGGWLQASVFSPSDSPDDAAAILQDPPIRQNLRDLISTVAAPALDTTQSQLAAFLDSQILTTKAGAAVMGETVGRIERVVIGQSKDQVVLTGNALVPIVRDQRAASLPDVTVPVQASGTMNTTRQIINWLIPISALLALVFVLAGAVMRPERNEVIRSFGEFLVALAISVLIFAFLIPAFILPALDSSDWVAMAPRLAYNGIAYTIGTMIVCAIAGAVLILWSFTGGTTRRQWSTPLSANRYKAERPHWS